MRGPTINQPTIPSIQGRGTTKCRSDNILRLLRKITFIHGIYWLILRIVVFFIATQSISSYFIYSVMIISCIISYSSIIKHVILTSIVVLWSIVLLKVVSGIVTLLMTTIASLYYNLDGAASLNLMNLHFLSFSCYEWLKRQDLLLHVFVSYLLRSSLILLEWVIQRAHQMMGKNCYFLLWQWRFPK